MTQETTKLPNYRPDIDGLRALAVVSVVLFHAFPDFMKGGYVGVDVFFVISGFLITGIIIGGLDAGCFSLVDFYARRVRRIFPALFLVLASVLIFGFFMLMASEYRDLGKHVAAGAGFVSNFVLIGEAGYFDASADTKPLLHLWSLGVEEQFYLVWPLLLWVASKGKINFLVLAGVIWIGSFVFNICQTSTDVVSAFYMPQARFWELLSGAALAIVSRRSGNLLSGVLARHKDHLSWGGIFLLTLCVFALRKKTDFPGWWALFPVAGAVALIAGGPTARANQLVLARPAVVWLGLISFPLYLWHWPLLAFARVLEGQTPSVVIRATGIVVSVILANLTYRIIEKPVRFGRYQNLLTIISLCLVALAGLFGYQVAVRDGYPERSAAVRLAPFAELYSNHQNEVFSDDGCKKYFPSHFDKLSACRLSKSDPPEVLLIGDSHSHHYYEALVSALPNVSIIHVARWSCLPFSTSSHAEKSDCMAVSQEVASVLENNSSIKLIIIAGHWSYLLSGGFAVENGDFRLPKAVSKAATESFIKNGKAFLEVAGSPGRRLVFVKDNPSLGFNIKSCFESRLPIFGHPVRPFCGIDRLAYSTQYMEYSQVIDAILRDFPEIKVFDPLTVLCDSEYCHAEDQGLPLYFDSDHLSTLGAKKVVGAMVNVLNLPSYVTRTAPQGRVLQELQ